MGRGRGRGRRGWRGSLLSLQLGERHEVQGLSTDLILQVPFPLVKSKGENKHQFTGRQKSKGNLKPYTRDSGERPDEACSSRSSKLLNHIIHKPFFERTHRRQLGMVRNVLCEKTKESQLANPKFNLGQLTVSESQVHSFQSISISPNSCAIKDHPAQGATSLPSFSQHHSL